MLFASSSLLEPIFDNMPPMCFEKKPTTWESVVNSEILGPFAPKSGWMCAQNKKDSGQATVTNSLEGSVSGSIRNLLSKILITKLLKKCLASAEDIRIKRHSSTTHLKTEPVIVKAAQRKGAFNDPGSRAAQRALRLCTERRKVFF